MNSESRRSSGPQRLFRRPSCLSRCDHTTELGEGVHTMRKLSDAELEIEACRLSNICRGTTSPLQ
jgi:hypothetical protein